MKKNTKLIRCPIFHWIRFSCFVFSIIHKVKFLSFVLYPGFLLFIQIILSPPFYIHKGHPRWRRITSCCFSCYIFPLGEREREREQEKEKYWTLAKARNCRHSFLVYFSFSFHSVSFMQPSTYLFLFFNQSLVIYSPSFVE